MSKELCNVEGGLVKVRDIISKYALQSPIAHRTGEAKVKYL